MPKHKAKARKGADGVVGGKKRCRRCGERKPVKTMFYTDTQDSPDGYRSYCKPCGQRMNAKYKANAAKRTKGGKGKAPALSAVS